MPSVQTLYPNSPSDAVRAAVIALLPAPEKLKLSACRGRSHCNSRFCPSCIQWAGHLRAQQVFQAASLITHPLRFGTFSGRDMPLERVREASTILMQTARTLCSHMRVKGSALRLEASDPSSNDYHPHIHGLLDTPSGGRNFIPEADWQDAWLTELPQWLHPPTGGAHVKPVRSLGASCTYMMKSVFSSLCEDAYDGDDLQRTLDYIESCKGVQQFSVRGSLAA
jgi:hypothetical protein